MYEAFITLVVRSLFIDLILDARRASARAFAAGTGFERVKDARVVLAGTKTATSFALAPK